MRRMQINKGPTLFVLAVVLFFGGYGLISLLHSIRLREAEQGSSKVLTFPIDGIRELRLVGESGESAPYKLVEVIWSNKINSVEVRFNGLLHTVSGAASHGVLSVDIASLLPENYRPERHITIVVPLRVPRFAAEKINTINLTGEPGDAVDSLSVFVGDCKVGIKVGTLSVRQMHWQSLCSKPEKDMAPEYASYSPTWSQKIQLEKTVSIGRLEVVLPYGRMQVDGGAQIQEAVLQLGDGARVDAGREFLSRARFDALKP